MNKFIGLLLVSSVVILIAGVVVTKQSKTLAPTLPVATITPTGTGFMGDNPAPSVPVPSINQASDFELSISSPVDNVVLTTPTLVIRGKTKAKAEVAINDKETVADSTGNFSVTMTLDEGENTFYILANDDMGNVAERMLTVIYDSGL